MKIWNDLPFTSKFQASELKGDKTIANFDEMDQGIKIVWGQDKTVSCVVITPSSKQQVPTQTVL